MNIALWIVAGLFGLAYIVGGILKIAMPHERYAAKNLWAQDFSPGNLKSMGVIEIFGGIGLILPGLLDVAPVLVPVAASGLALYMAGAVTERVRRGEWPHLLGDLVFLSAMLFVAWGRFGPEAWV
jgi:hypothetical protein